jgi:iron complex outermembrane receptor protein
MPPFTVPLLLRVCRSCDVLRRLVVLLVVAALVPAARPAAAAAKRTFALSAGDAAVTLRQFAEQSGEQVIYVVPKVRGVKTNPVHGEFTAREVLERMLANTELVIVQDRKTGAWLVQRVPARKRAATEAAAPESGGKSGPSPASLMQPKHLLTRVAAAFAALAVPLADAADTAAPAAAAAPVQLSPFEVTAENDHGYVAGNTLGATRVNTLIRDLPLQINVVTEDMIRDFIAYDLDQVIDHLPGVSREFNEFVPTYSVRGFSSSAALRNGVRSLHAPDTNSVARVEVIKGPAALLYGTSNPGGVVNYITRQPGSRPRAEVSAAFGNHGFRRYGLSLGGPLPVGDGKKLGYLLDAVWFEHEHGERQRNLRRLSLAPVLRWTPFAGTSITLRGTQQKDDFVSSGGLLLLPPNDPVRTSTSTPRLPHWAVELGRDYNIHSPSSWVDVASGVVELEIKQRVSSFLDFRANLADHYRPRSSFREGGSNFLNPGAVVPAPAPFDNPAPGAPVSLTGPAPAYDPIARTGWRTVSFVRDERVERRRTLQLDLVGRFATGPFGHTILGGFERNLESRSSRGRSWLNAAGQGLATFTYEPFDPVSTARKDLWVRLNQPPLESLPINSFATDYSSNSSFYASLTTRFLGGRGLLLAGGRYDDVRGGSTARPRNITTGVLGAQTGREGTTDRVTPQAGVSFRIAEPVTGYVMFSQSVNPRIAFQPLRTEAAELRITETYEAAGLPVPDFNTLPWDDALDPEFGTSLEYGLKWEIFRRRLQGTIAVFDIHRRNISSAVEGTLGSTGVGFRELAGKTRARGVDVDVAWSPTRDFQIVGGMLFNETEIVFDNNRGEIGRRMRNAPRWSGSVTSRYAFSRGALKGAAGGASWTYMGLRRENDPLRWSEDWNRTDLFASYRTKIGRYPVSLAFNVKNLFDRTFRVDRDTFAAGREYRLSITYTLR